MLSIGSIRLAGSMFDHGFAKMACLVGNALKRMANGILNLVRRAGERDRLSELSALERRDLGHHRVHDELNKWPWQH
jgi:hypothetical protein